MDLSQRARAAATDPITNLERLDDDVSDAEPSAEDLRPHMEGWDPSAPRKGYGAAYGRTDQQPLPAPQPRSWHPGMQGKPTWWRHQ